MTHPSNGITAIGFDFYNTLLPYRMDNEYSAFLKKMSAKISEEFGPFPEDQVIASNYKSIEVLRGQTPPMRELAMRKRIDIFFEDLTGRQPNENEVGRLDEIFTVCSVEASSFPDSIPKMLGRLKKKFKLGIISNLINPKTIPMLLERNNLRELFDVVILSAEWGYVKPHPSIFEAFFQAMRVLPEQVLFVGDSLQADIAGASARGCKTAWAKEFSFPETSVAKQDYILESLSQLETIFG